MNNSKVAGAIIVAGEHGQNLLIDGLEKLKIKVFLVDSYYYLSNKYNEIRACNYPAGIECADYLIGKSHKRFAVVRYNKLAFSMRQRCDGFTERIVEKGFDRPKIYCVDAVLSDKCKELDRMITEMKPPFAVFCMNDFLANHVVFYVRKNGLRVPEDVSVVGFDNARIVEPAVKLTTFNVPKMEMGKRAAELLIDSINSNDKIVEKTEIAVTLVEGESVADLKTI